MSRHSLRVAGALCTLLLSAALPAAAQAKPNKKVCAAAPAGYASCQSRVVTDASGRPAATAGPSGYGPADLASAYKLAGTSGAGRTVAIVDAFDDPNAESDLAAYRSKFGLPACTTANGCFRKVDQNGGTSYPRRNASWAQEISLDVDMASAICPGCKILLVETASNSLANLGTGVNTASRLGAFSISNSYGGSEYSSEASDAGAYYNHPNVTASSGDSGYGVEFPAAAAQVTAVGGTSLTSASNARGFSETAWSGAGSGCSAYVPKPAWQKDAGCARRSVADVSAVADPNTGVAVYDTFRTGGWLVFGGTSVSSPIVASIYALGGNSTVGASRPYATPSALFDVAGGANGSCSPGYLCAAGSGYDGPTGLGTPNGTGAF
ncbi:MAG: S53 family peptidase [Solirubrobacteraceae bacterium]